MALGSLKSHPFSTRPTKSRMAGSADQARRSAARVNSGGTPGCRKRAHVGVGADRFDRRQLGEIERRPVCGSPARPASAGAAARSFVFFGFRLRRSRRLVRRLAVCAATIARENFPARSWLVLIRCVGGRRPSASGSARSRWRLTKARSTWCSATKAATDVAHRLRHRHGLDDGRRDARPSLRPRPDRRSPRRARTADRPPLGRSTTHSSGVLGHQVVAIVARFRAIQFDLGRAGIKSRALAVVGQLASKAASPARRSAPPTGRQRKSLHGLAPLLRSTTTPTAMVVSGVTTLIRPPPDAGSAGRSPGSAASCGSACRASSPESDRPARLCTLSSTIAGSRKVKLEQADHARHGGLVDVLAVPQHGRRSWWRRRRARHTR